MSRMFYHLIVIVKILTSPPVRCLGQIFDLVETGHTFANESYYEVTLKSDRQCIGLCKYNQLCVAYEATPIISTTTGIKGVECRFFDFTHHYYRQNVAFSLVEKIGARLYSTNIEAKTCKDWYRYGYKKNGVYEVKLQSGKQNVYCFMEGEGGGWMAFQRRFDGSVSFHDKSFSQYENGFGVSDGGEYWLGLEKLHLLTTSKSHDLFVIVKTFSNETQVKRFASFAIGTPASKYVFSYDKVLPRYSEFELFKRPQGQKFSTFDQDNDSKGNGACSSLYPGGWWFSNCHDDFMNGQYYPTEVSGYGMGLHWYKFQNNNCYKSLKKTLLLVREN
ncbi:microfibril-associated glycoprotein 4-like [Clytia hemisphaerica]|uniref:microfibril-associated glycoprotein 4-like n=1 Tax=Clytia hemisphaerica TaxID=252671 RepID=UPI0034D4CCAA